MTTGSALLSAINVWQGTQGRRALLPSPLYHPADKRQNHSPGFPLLGLAHLHTPLPISRDSSIVLPMRGTGTAVLSIPAGEGQSQFPHSHDPELSSPTCCKFQGTTQQARDRTAFPCSNPWDWLMSTSPTPATTLITPTLPLGQLYCAVHGSCKTCSHTLHAPSQGHLSHLPVETAKRKRSLLFRYHHIADKRQGQLLPLGPAHPQAPHPGSTLLCCPCKV